MLSFWILYLSMRFWEQSKSGVRKIVGERCCHCLSRHAKNLKGGASIALVYKEWETEKSKKTGVFILEDKWVGSHKISHAGLRKDGLVFSVAFCSSRLWKISIRLIHIIMNSNELSGKCPFLKPGKQIRKADIWNPQTGPITVSDISPWGQQKQSLVQLMWNKWVLFKCR